MPVYNGNLYVKNTSGTSVKVTVIDKKNKEHSDIFQPGIDKVISDIFIADQFFPPNDTNLIAILYREDGNEELRRREIKFRRILAYSAASLVFDCFENKPCFEVAEIPSLVTEKLENQEKEQIERELNELGKLPVTSR
jgi:hypothetical protein